MKNVLIFRHQLFKVSEPFITQQAEHLEKYKPIYIGRSRFGEAPTGSLSLALEDLSNQHSLYQRLWQVVTRDSYPYVELLTDYKPNLIHAHFGVEGIYALPLSRRLGIPLVVTFHGFDATTSTSALIRSGSPSWINYALLRHQLAKHGDLFLCVSEYTRDRVLELGFPKERTHVHYIGVDTQAIKPRDQKRQTPSILHVARLVEKKGTEYLLRAFAQVTKENPKAELIIIGDGPLRAQLSALTDNLGIHNHVNYLGTQSHDIVIEWMHRATMLVIPSVCAKSGDQEGLPIVLLEAAAAGLPVIGTHHSGIPEAIADGKSGFIVSERNISQLAKKICYLLNDRIKCINMGLNNRTLVETRFDIRNQTAKLEAYYDSVLL